MKQKSLWLVVLLATSAAFASQNPGAVFLMIWPGARQTAMAGAFTAIADDPLCMYYNPGGLGFLNGTRVTLQHANWLPGLYEGMYFENLALSHQLSGSGTVGVNATYLTTGETDVVNERGEFLGRYTTFDLALPAVYYGYPVLKNLGVGIGVKPIYSFLVPDWVWKVMPELGIEQGGTGLTWGVDAGVLYKPFDFLNVGLALANFGPNISYTSSGESDPLPRMLRLGAAYYPVKSKIVTVCIAPEVTKILVGMFYNPDGTKTFSRMMQEELRGAWKHLAIEAGFANLLFARVGYFEDLDGQRGGIVLEKEGTSRHYGIGDLIARKNLGDFKSIGMTFGGGIEFARFKFDVSVDQLIYDFPTSNYKFSLSYQF
jgi:hypothetical protein